jgi:hypothetical protein
MFLADQLNQVIRIINLKDKSVTTLAGEHERNGHVDGNSRNCKKKILLFCFYYFIIFFFCSYSKIRWSFWRFYLHSYFIFVFIHYFGSLFFFILLVFYFISVALTLNNDRLFVCDKFSGTIREVNTQTGFVSTFAGAGKTGKTKHKQCTTNTKNIN